MKTLEIVATAPGQYQIGGHLTFATINKHTPIALTTDGEQLTLDFDQVEASDSAGLALIVEWVKHSRNRQINIRLINLPEQIKALAKLSGIESILTSAPH